MTGIAYWQKICPFCVDNDDYFLPLRLWQSTAEAEACSSNAQTGLRCSDSGMQRNDFGIQLTSVPGDLKCPFPSTRLMVVDSNISKSQT